MLFSENMAYEGYYRQRYHLFADKFRRVPHGADEHVYHPRSVEAPVDFFQVTYHGTYLPSHGMDAIIKAAILLREEAGIVFHFYGQGPEQERIEDIAVSERLKNVNFHGFVEQEELLDALARSHVCLGVFGTTKQSHFTIQNKVWQGLAMGRAVISGDSLVVRESLDHKEHIYLVERDNAQAIAAAIRELKEDSRLRKRIAQGGYERFLANNSVKAIGAATVKALTELTERP
jgi:glycosyltransferase involved in cell wall biosynthesis